MNVIKFGINIGKFVLDIIKHKLKQKIFEKV